VSVLAVLEQRGGKWNRQSFEALTAARRIADSIGDDLEAVVIGSGIGALGAEAATYPVNGVILIDDSLLADYTPDAWAAALGQLLSETNPRAVVFPHSYQVRDFAPKLATRLGLSFVSDVVDVKPGPVLVRQLFQGKINADIEPSGPMILLSVQAGAFRAASPGGGNSNVKPFGVKLDAAQIRNKPEAPFRESQRSVDLGAAEIIVSVGRGIGEKDNLNVVEALAESLGAELAASRPICDNGWLPMERQVGSSGQTVAPKLYLAVGISGAIQHLVGMKGSKTIVAINKDETAPIFEAADYGIVGDLFEVVPALTEEIKKAKA
jgi:electron transfer flavoprotein alpha subunit